MHHELPEERNPYLDEAHDARPRAADLLIDARFQIRGEGGKLDQRTVKRYADAMRAGHRFPPLKALRVDGALVLVDGFHRREAARFNGCEGDLEVEVIGDGSAAEARWLAFDANRQHGLPLKTRAMRAGFKAYVHAQKNLVTEGAHKGRPKSYRQMMADLGVGRQTLHNWMRKDFPRLYRALSSAQDAVMTTGERGPNWLPAPEEISPMTPQELLEQAVKLAAMRPDDAHANRELLDAVERFAEELRARPHDAVRF
jgi:hypothetical protein